MITRTIGATGNHVDIAAWVSYVQANYVVAGNLTDDQTGAIIAAGLTVTTAQIISGWAPSVLGYTTTLTYDPASSGAAWYGPNCRSNAFFYNTARGAFISSSYSSGGATGAVTWRVEKNRTIGLMIKATGGYTRALSYDTTTITDLLVEGNILWATSEVDGVLYLSTSVDGANCFVRNNACISERGAGGSCAGIANGSNSFTNRVRFYDNVFWADQGVPLRAGSGSYIEVIGNSFIARTANCAVSARDAQTNGSNNATNNAAFNNTGYGAGTITGLTSTQFSITLANEYIGVTTGALATDFRLKSGGTALQGTNIPITGVTIDATNITRSNPTDIGPYQFSSGGTTYNVSIAETASAADAPASNATLPSAVAEAGAAAETVSNIGTFPRTITEAGSAADTVANGTTYSVGILESASTADTTNAVLTAVGAILEAASAAELVSNIGTFPRTITETATAVDAPSSNATLPSAIVEAASAADTLNAILTAVGAIVEAANAVNVQATTATLPNTITETMNATDTEDAPPAGVVNILEVMNAVDTVSAVVIMAANIVEAASAANTQGSTATLPGTVAETATITDTLSGKLIAVATIAEAANATDAYISQLLANVAITEAANAQDTLTASLAVLTPSKCDSLMMPPVVRSLLMPEVVRSLNVGCECA